MRSAECKSERLDSELRTPNSELGKRGAALFITFLMMLVMTGLALAVGVASHNSVVGGRSQLHDKQAFYIAEAGWQRARQALNADTWFAAVSPGNSYTESFGAGEYVVTIVDNGSSRYTVTSEGYLPSQSSPLVKRKIIESSIPVTGTPGTNLSLAATPSASSSTGSNTASKANDGSLSTKWQASNQGSGEWLKMDYGSATLLSKIVIQEDASIDGLTIEYSDNNSSWTAPSGLSVVESPSQTWTATFPKISHRYFRARFTDVPSNKKASVNELQTYNETFTFSQGAVTTQW